MPRSVETPARVSVAPYQDRLDVWSATWRIIQTRPWLGVGPGNFAMTYPRFMPAQAWEKAREPHDFLLEVWSNYGLFALVALVVALGIFFWRVAKWWNTEGAAPVRRPNIAAEKGAAPDKPGPTTIGWEYYLGGMFGVLLGFVLRASQLPAGALIDEALTAGVRSMAWFAAFGLLERVAWTDRERVAALAAGVAACLFCLLVGDGIGFPSVAGPLWVVVALGLAIVAPAPLAWMSRQQTLLFVPVPVLAGTALAFGLFIFVPIVASSTATLQALANRQALVRDRAKPAEERELKAASINYQLNGVVAPLRKAEEETPAMPAPASASPALTSKPGRWTITIPTRPGRRRAGRSWRSRPTGRARGATSPSSNCGPRFANLYLRLQDNLANEVKKKKATEEDRKRIQAKLQSDLQEQRVLIVTVLQRCVDLDPTDAPLRYRLAEALREAKHTAAARLQAREALRLHRLSRHRLRQLTDQQFRNAFTWSIGEEGKAPVDACHRRERTLGSGKFATKGVASSVEVEPMVEGRHAVAQRRLRAGPAGGRRGHLLARLRRQDHGLGIEEDQRGDEERVTHECALTRKTG